MNCYMFPGQPLTHNAQLPDDSDFSEIAELTLLRTGVNLHDFTRQGEDGSVSAMLQIYGVAMSLYQARRFRLQGVRPDLIAEHSMGIYPALAVSGSISEGDALELTWRVGCCMNSMKKSREYALGCVVGLTLEPVLSIAENNGVYLANLNTSRHFLLSGERRNMEAAETEALADGAFSVKLFPSDAPLHTPLMAEIEGEMRGVFSDYRYLEPNLPLLDHINQDFLAATEITEFMIRELELPVYWEKSFIALKKAGVGKFFEVGVGDSLKKYNRWIENEASRQ